MTQIGENTAFLFSLSFKTTLKNFHLSMACGEIRKRLEQIILRSIEVQVEKGTIFAESVLNKILHQDVAR